MQILVKKWPTPTAESLVHAAEITRKDGKHRLESTISKLTAGQPDQDRNNTTGSSHGQLNPDWVEIASRVDRLRLLGNGVVPRTAALAWRCLHNNI